MAVEAKRGCGYRKEGGLYLVGSGLSAPCDRMPYRLDRCRTCGGGIKFTRGLQWLQPDFFTPHESLVAPCLDESVCPICVNGGPDASRSASADDLFGPHLLLWIGRGHYSPEAFLEEGRRLGVSRRIAALPKGLVLGETWVLLAHPDAVPPPKDERASWARGPDHCVDCGFTQPEHGADGELAVCRKFNPPKPSPGIFCAFVPHAVELILKQSDATPERVEKERKRGVSVVAVPDDDPDHQGSVWDAKDDDSQPELPGASP